MNKAQCVATAEVVIDALGDVYEAIVAQRALSQRLPRVQTDEEVCLHPQFIEFLFKSEEFEGVVRVRLYHRAALP